MTTEELAALIEARSQADAAFAALVEGGDPTAIASALSVGRTRLATVERQDFAMWCGSTGLRAGIEDAAATVGHPLRSVALTLLDFLRGGVADSIDFGLGANQQMLGAWVIADGCTQAQADQLLAMATVADPVQPSEVEAVLAGSQSGATVESPTFAVGALVRVQPPFDSAFPGEYIVESVAFVGGVEQAQLAGLESAFAVVNLRAAE